MNKHPHRGNWLLLILPLLLFLWPESANVYSASRPQSNPPGSVTLSNGYRLTFEQVTAHADGTSTWHYLVEELPSAKDLGYWVLALPVCTTIVTATPTEWEAVSPDPNTQLTGIKWETDDRFQQGEFTVTLTGHWAVTTVEVAAKGPHVAHGLLAGPGCEPATIPQPTAASSPTATDTPSSTPTGTATPTLVPTDTASPTNTSVPTMTPTTTATPTPTDVVPATNTSLPTTTSSPMRTATATKTATPQPTPTTSPAPTPFLYSCR